MRPLRFVCLALAGLLAACNEGPFIDRQIDPRVSKPVDTVSEHAQIFICYGAADEFPAAEKLATDTCAAYGLQTRLIFNDRYQCRLGTPHRASFRCFDPDMTDALGKPINPFNERAVAEWRKRTGGKKAAVIPRADLLPGAGPGGTATTAPKPAEITPLPPAAAPPPAKVEPAPPAPPIPPPPEVDGGFTLHPGSWGEAFDRQQ